MWWGGRVEGEKADRRRRQERWSSSSGRREEGPAETARGAKRDGLSEDVGRLSESIAERKSVEKKVRKVEIDVSGRATEERPFMMYLKTLRCLASSDLACGLSLGHESVTNSFGESRERLTQSQCREVEKTVNSLLREGVGAGFKNVRSAAADILFKRRQFRGTLWTKSES